MDGLYFPPKASGGAGTGTVTSVSVTTANGVSGSVTNPTTTPAITLTLGAITPSSVNASGALSASNFSGTSSGTNTGDQTITLTGDVTGSGTGSFAATVSANVVKTNRANTYTSGIQYLNGAVIEEAVYSNGNSGTSLAINLDNGNLQSVTITGAVAITLTAPMHPGKFTLIVTQDGSGHVYSISGVKWPGGSAPAYSTAASKIDVISLIYDGTNWYGMGGIAFA